MGDDVISHYNVISHWLGAYTKWSLNHYPHGCWCPGSYCCLVMSIYENDYWVYVIYMLYFLWSRLSSLAFRLGSVFQPLLFLLSIWFHWFHPKILWLSWGSIHNLDLFGIMFYRYFSITSNHSYIYILLAISVAYRYRKSISIIELFVSIISIYIGFLVTNF